MKKMLARLSVVFCCLACAVVHAQEIKPSRVPNKTQQRMIDRGYGMFVHFGLNTFADVEWSDGTLPTSLYNPTDLDPDQWVRVARDAGFRYILLITKHHEGFCLWDSKYTEYDVASSPVKTDVVRAVSEACKKYGLEFAIYYSLWDRKEPSYKAKDPQRYIDYMKNQLTELLTDYGPIAEVWLDGGWDKKAEEWGIDQLYSLVKKYQPYAAFSVNHTIAKSPGAEQGLNPSAMTEDDKYTFRYFPSDFRLLDPHMITLYDKKQYLHNGESYYLPFEHTICIGKRWNWFQKSQDLPVRDLDELEELFYWSTANNNSLVLNIPPDRTGKIKAYEASTAIALAKRLKLKKGKPLPKNGRIVSGRQEVYASSIYGNSKTDYDGNKLTDGKMDSRWAAKDTLAYVDISLNKNDRFNKISIFESQDVKNAGDGVMNIRIPRIQEYKISILNDGTWKTIYVGSETVGDCKVILFPNHYQADKLRFEVTKATAPPSLFEINVIDKI